MASKAEVAKVLLSTAALYTSFKMPPAPRVSGELDERDVWVSSWVRFVGHVETTLLQAAMDHAVTRCPQFFPTPAEVLEAVAAIQMPAGMSGEEAWGLVMADVRRGVGYPYQGDHADNPPRTEATVTDAHILAAVSDVGGWKLLATSTNEEDISHRARFSKAYEARVKRSREALSELPTVAKARELQAGRRAEMALLTSGIGKGKP